MKRKKSEDRKQKSAVKDKNSGARRNVRINSCALKDEYIISMQRFTGLEKRRNDEGVF